MRSKNSAAISDIRRILFSSSTPLSHSLSEEIHHSLVLEGSGNSDVYWNVYWMYIEILILVSEAHSSSLINNSLCVIRKISLNKETERAFCGCFTASDVKQMDGVSFVCLAPRAQHSVQDIKRGQKLTMNVKLRSRESPPLHFMFFSFPKRCFHSYPVSSQESDTTEQLHFHFSL